VVFKIKQMLSIIIPTYNEHEFLPRLLGSIKAQDFTDYEIIVADAKSIDNTPNLAKEYGAVVVGGGMPAAGRNAGARVARGDFFLFLDADVVLPAHFLKNANSEIQERFIDLATCEIVPISDFYMDKVLHRFTNLFIRMSQYSNPHAPGFCILVSRRLFQRAGGFDETLTMAEDHEFVKRASHFRPLRVLDSTFITVSVRRLEKEGRLTLAQKYLQVELYRAFIGEPRTEVVTYEFGKFAQEPDAQAKKGMLAFDRQMINLQNRLAEFSKKYDSLEDQFSAGYRQGLENFRERFDSLKKAFITIIKPNSLVNKQHKRGRL
jgi:glycosyltransferase involved in cell wall biosynthesis